MGFVAAVSRGGGALLALLVVVVLAGAVALLMRMSKRRQFTGRVLLPFVFIELAVYFFILTLGFPESDEVGSAVVPRLWMIGIVGLNLYLLVRALAGAEQHDPKPGRIDIVLLFVALSAVYLFSMQFIGYFIATFLFIMAGMLILSYKRVLVMVSVAAGWLVISYLAFFRLLYVPLPVGSLIKLIL